jgi:hypothetical protein
MFDRASVKFVACTNASSHTRSPRTHSSRIRAASNQKKERHFPRLGAAQSTRNLFYHARAPRIAAGAVTAGPNDRRLRGPEPPVRALISLPGSDRPSVKLRVAMRSMGRFDEIASDATSSRIGRASQLFVARQTRLHGVELCAYQRERVAADQQMLWRLRHVHQSEDRRRSLVRIT